MMLPRCTDSRTSGPVASTVDGYPLPRPTGTRTRTAHSTNNIIISKLTDHHEAMVGGIFIYESCLLGYSIVIIVREITYAQSLVSQAARASG